MILIFQPLVIIYFSVLLRCVLMWDSTQHWALRYMISKDTFIRLFFTP